MKLWITLLATLAILPCFSFQEVNDRWIIETKSPYEFAEFNEYLIFKVNESHKIAGEPSSLNGPDDLLRHHYFSGKEKAFKECFEWLK